MSTARVHHQPWRELTLIMCTGSAVASISIEMLWSVKVVKSVVVPRIVAREEELDRLQSLFAELGFSSGDSWNDKRSRGLPMLAPMGALEFYHGQPPAPADVIVEVEDIARAMETVQRHGMRIVAETGRTHWGADLFVALIGGCHIAFFQWAEKTDAPELKAA
jgi:hypothetical protein